MPLILVLSIVFHVLLITGVLSHRGFLEKSEPEKEPDPVTLFLVEREPDPPPPSPAEEIPPPAQDPPPVPEHVPPPTQEDPLPKDPVEEATPVTTESVERQPVKK